MKGQGTTKDIRIQCEGIMNVCTKYRSINYDLLLEEKSVDHPLGQDHESLYKILRQIIQ